MAFPLLTYVRKGMALVPIGRHQNRFSDAFEEGETYAMAVHEDRSWASHNHYFACIKDHWLSLPERAAMETWAQSPEHLRKYALIQTGWNDTHSHACKSAAEAQRTAAFVRPIDEFSVVIARGSIVERFTAKSQSMRAMGKADFERSKEDVLGFLETLVGGQTTGDAA